MEVGEQGIYGRGSGRKLERDSGVNYRGIVCEIRGNYWKWKK